ncbi:hypothetical protein Drorol1_Dr00013674 [Drosera rotundifolia]
MANPQQQEQESHTLDQQSPTSVFFDALYCEEEEEDQQHWEDENSGENGGLDLPSLKLTDQDLIWDGPELSNLLSKEKGNSLLETLEGNPSMGLARSETVGWILRVHAHYSFHALTAFLAVNYFDRFLSSFQFQREKPWMAQLAAVACLSLAAKVEETHVPLLLDLQVEDANYVFEAKTIQRMEILVLSTLGWKMNPVTPHSFVDYIARRLGLKNHLCWEFLRRTERALVSLISDSRVMSYLPSVIAAAVVLHVFDSLAPSNGDEYQNEVLGILGSDKDKVEACGKLILELAAGGKILLSNKRKPVSMPGSPNGVIDVSFSCDSSNDSWAVASSVSSSPEPLSKKMRTEGRFSERLYDQAMEIMVELGSDCTCAQSRWVSTRWI